MNIDKIIAGLKWVTPGGSPSCANEMLMKHLPQGLPLRPILGSRKCEK